MLWTEIGLRFKEKKNSSVGFDFQILFALSHLLFFLFQKSCQLSCIFHCTQVERKVKLSSDFKILMKTTELTILLRKKNRLFEMYFDLIQFSLQPKYYGKLHWEQNQAHLKIFFLLKFQSKCTVLDSCLHRRKVIMCIAQQQFVTSNKLFCNL